MHNTKLGFLFTFIIATIFFACNNHNANTPEHIYDEDVLSSIISNTDSLKTFDFVNEKVAAIKAAMAASKPILLCGDSLDDKQKLAQQLAINDTAFTRFTRNTKNNNPYRNEIFAVRWIANSRRAWRSRCNSKTLHKRCRWYSRYSR